MKKAVGLGYNKNEDNAPKVIAKGVGTVAERIIEKAIEHGKELSPELFRGIEKEKQPKDPLTSSLVTIGAGIAIFIALFLFFDNQLKFAAFGLIPLFVGLGQLTAYLINKKNGK